MAEYQNKNLNETYFREEIKKFNFKLINRNLSKLNNSVYFL